MKRVKPNMLLKWWATILEFFLMCHVANVSVVSGDSTAMCSEKNYFYINNALTNREIITASSCEIANFMSLLPVENTREKHFSVNNSRTVNFTWSDRIPGDVEYAGYIVRLTNSFSNSERCVFVEFEEKINLIGEIEFRLDCIPWITRESLTCSSVFPVIKQQDNCKLTSLTFNVAFDRSNKIMRLTSDEPLLTGVFILRLLSGSAKTECTVDRKEIALHILKFPESGHLYVYDLPYRLDNLCIEVQPLDCENRTVTKMINFNSDDTFSYNRPEVRKWKATFFLSTDFPKLEAKFSIEGLENSNITEFHVTLFHVRSESENCIQGSLPRIRCLHIYNNSNSGLKATFSNLTPGNYCVRLTPINTHCKKCLYRPQNSGVKELIQVLVKPPSEVKPILEPDYHFPLLEIVIPIAIAVVAIIIIVVILLRRQHQRHFRLQQISWISQNLSLKDVISTVNKKVRVKILLLICVKNPNVKSAVNYFAKVLENCLHCEVTLNNYLTACNESDKLGISYLEWISRKLREVDFVLFMVPDFDISDPDQKQVLIENEQLMYLYCLDIIDKNATGTWSDKNVCVFRFDGFPLYEILPNVVQVTWCLPKHLGNFYSRLHNMPVVETEFQEHWKKDHLFISLKSSIAGLASSQLSETDSRTYSLQNGHNFILSETI